MSNSNKDAIYPNNIRKFRVARGISQQQLADICNTHRSTISAWENNKYQPENIYLLHKIANALGIYCSDDLIDWEHPIYEPDEIDEVLTPEKLKELEESEAIKRLLSFDI